MLEAAKRAFIPVLSHLQNNSGILDFGPFSGCLGCNRVVDPEFFTISCLEMEIKARAMEAPEATAEVIPRSRITGVDVPVESAGRFDHF